MKAKHAQSSYRVVQRLRRSAMAVAAVLLAIAGLVGPDAQAEEVELLISSEDEPVAGTLVLPERSEPPLVILISGSGAQERDSVVFDFPIFARLAEELRVAGIASFRFDDRGTGQSGGVFADATLDRLVADVAVVVDHFKVFGDRSFEEVILYGHSQGGLIAGRLAALDSRIDRVILAASSGMNLRRILRQQVSDAYLQSEVPADLIEQEISAREQIMFAIADEGDVDAARDAYAAVYSQVLDELPAAVRDQISDPDAFARNQADQLVLAFSSPQMQSMLFHDPVTDMTGIDNPVLLIFAERDTQVLEALNRPLIEAALQEAGSDFETVVIDDANHLFQKAETGQVSEYETLEKAFAPGFVEAIVSWIDSPESPDAP